MADSKNKPKQPNTSEFLDISQIRDAILILKNGSLRSIVEVNSVNFELKSADEQTAIIQAFQGFINSIDFPLQIVVASRKLDIGPYLKSLDSLLEKQSNELLRIQATEYNRFIQGLTELANIMSKKFYIVVPFYAVETPSAKKGLGQTFKSLFLPSKFIKSLSDEELENYKTQINQRVDMITSGISGLGLESKLLGNDDLISLFYTYYNPGHQLKTT